MWRVLYRLYRIGSWFLYRVPRRFTHSGLLVICGIGLTAVLGLDTENLVAYQAFALLVVLLAASMCFGRRLRAKFTAERRLPRFGTVGMPLRYRIVLRNESKRRQRGLAVFDELADSRPNFAEWKAFQKADEKLVRSFQFSKRRRVSPFRLAMIKPGEAPEIGRGEAAEVEMEILPLRRGVLRTAAIRVARTDPFGLIRAFQRIASPQTVLILPKRYPMPSIALPGTMKYQEGGVALASNVGQSEEFVSLRDYRRGDPMRHIHWRSWARAGKPIVKEFEDEFFVRHALVLDTFTAVPQDEAFEEAVSVAASFACTVGTQDSLLDLLFAGEEAYCFTSGRGLAHADQMLEILASVRPCMDRPFSILEDLILNHIGAVTGCICVLLDWNEARRKFVNKIREMGVPVMLLLIVPPGWGVSPAASALRESPFQVHLLEVGRVQEGLQKL